MTETINYSIIIPHKNIPDLLQRCLDSIPRRKDVQIIVVDDNSDKSIVDFDNFPGLNDPYVEVYFTKKGKGAGYARNVGLEHAVGKWVLFADADDMFSHELNNCLDDYINSEHEVIVFRCLNKVEECIYDNPIYHAGFDDALRGIGRKTLLFKYVVPYGKFIKRSIINGCGIKFQEVKYSNDVLFAMQLAKSVNDIELVDKCLYIVIDRKNSLFRNDLWQNYYVRTKVALDAYLCVKSEPDTDFVQRWYFYFWEKLFQKKKILSLIMLPRIYFIIRKDIANYYTVGLLQKEYPFCFSVLKKIKNFFYVKE